MVEQKEKLFKVSAAELILGYEKMTQKAEVWRFPCSIFSDLFVPHLQVVGAGEGEEQALSPPSVF